MNGKIIQIIPASMYMTALYARKVPEEESEYFIESTLPVFALALVEAADGTTSVVGMVSRDEQGDALVPAGEMAGTNKVFASYERKDD